MGDLQELIDVMKENNRLLQQLVDKNSGRLMVGVKEAAGLFSISEAIIREMCEKGIIKATLKNPDSKNKHWVIDVAQARADLTKCGYLAEKAHAYSKPSRRGRKSKIDLNTNTHHI